ncbi:MAG: DMT family transporter [Lachnospiraceae bacterium]
MKKRSESFYIMLISIEAILMGVGNPVAKFGISLFPFFEYMAMRFLLGFLFLVILFHKKLIAGFRGAHIKSCVWISIFTTASYVTGTLAFKYTTATTAGFLFSLPVVFTPFLMWFVSKKRMNKKHIIPIVLVIIGLYFLCCGEGSFRFGLGEGLAMGSALLMACTLEFSAKHLEKADSIFLATFQAGFVGIVCLIIGLVSKEQFPALTSVPMEAWGAVLYLGIGCTGIAYGLQNSALCGINSTKAALVLCAEPVFTAVASYFMLGEVLSVTGWVGAVIIMVSIVLASVRTD